MSTGIKWAPTELETMGWANYLDRTTPRLHESVKRIEASAAEIRAMQARIKEAEERLARMVRNHEAEVAGLQVMVAKLWTEAEIKVAEELFSTLGKKDGE